MPNSSQNMIPTPSKSPRVKRPQSAVYSAKKGLRVRKGSCVIQSGQLKQFIQSNYERNDPDKDIETLSIDFQPQPTPQILSSKAMFKTPDIKKKQSKVLKMKLDQILQAPPEGEEIGQ